MREGRGNYQRGASEPLNLYAIESVRGEGKNGQNWKNSTLAEFGQYCLFSLFFFFFMYSPLAPPPAPVSGQGGGHSLRLYSKKSSMSL